MVHVVHVARGALIPGPALVSSFYIMLWLNLTAGRKLSLYISTFIEPPQWSAKVTVPRAIFPQYSVHVLGRRTRIYRDNIIFRLSSLAFRRCTVTIL